MKNRRLNILLIAALALAVTPRAWQQFRSLVTAVQNQAQRKLVDMLVNSDREGYRREGDGPASLQLAAWEVRPADNRRSERASLKSAVTLNDVRSGRAAAAPSQRRAQAVREALALAAQHDLLARDSQSFDQEALAKALLRSEILSEEQSSQEAHRKGLASVAMSTEPLDLPHAPPAPASDNFTFVMLPAAQGGGTVSFENAAPLQLKLKKVGEETRVLRQKVRYVKAATTLVVPVSSTSGTMSGTTLYQPRTCPLS
ncbi:MAG TPA: hypothetical protein VF723_04410 [Pyrinomonadaceae bacterium]|jgi:hypothetical protein